MKSSSKLLYGLLMSYLCFRVTDSSDEISVIQNPPNITVYEGESSEITCCWSTMTNIKVVWYKNETRILTENTNKFQQYQISPVHNCSTLHILNITPNDTGVYVCKVIKDKPLLIEFSGNKTVVTVKEKQQCTKTPATADSGNSSAQPHSTAMNHSEPPSSLILPLSLAVTVVLLTFCLVFSVYKMRNACKNSERVVIHQTPNSEGEEHENNEEELSTGSSRGSLQWYQVPVYWSYFDLRRGEDQ